MRIDYSSTLMLETVGRNVYSCSRSGMDGYIDAAHFEKEPFDAALIALSPLWKNANFNDLEDFLVKWECLRGLETSNSVDVSAYVQELKKTCA